MPARTLDVNAFDAFLKEIYPNVRVESLAMKDRPLLSYFPRYDEFYGDAYVVPVLYEDPQGRAANLQDAINQAENLQGVRFVATQRKFDYGVVQISGEVMMAASKDVGSFIRAREKQINGMIRNIGKSIHLALYRSGSGSLSQISAIAPGGTQVTLQDASATHYFGVGQFLIANDTDDAVSPRTGLVRVDRRSVSAGTLDLDQDVTSLASPWQVGDYLFTNGDQGAKVVGLDGWLPSSEPVPGDNFFTVDRSLDGTRLGGQRVSGPGTVSERLQTAAVLIGEEGGEPDTVFMNPRDGLLLSAELQLQVERQDGDREGFGFSGFRIENFITGPIQIVFDHGCPQGRCYMLQQDTWRLAHMGPLPHIIRDDGRDSLRGANEDNIQVRARAFLELLCEAPGYNAVIDLT